MKLVKSAAGYRNYYSNDADDEEAETISLESEDDSPKDLPEVEFKKYLGLMKALQAFYQHAHWIAKGEPYYGDHLLFERLYSSLNGQVDAMGEKMVGLGGDHFVCVKAITNITSKILEHVPDMDENTLGYELVKEALKLENTFLAYTTKLYKKLKEDNSITLGLDDMLMSLCNEHESNVYLLKQRIKRA